MLLTIKTDDETDMKELEAGVRAIEQDGLLWGSSTLVAVGFGIKKLQINLVVEDEKVSLDELQGKIEEDEDHVQSTDIVSISFSCFCKSMLMSPITGCYGEAINPSLLFDPSNVMANDQTCFFIFAIHGILVR